MSITYQEYRDRVQYKGKNKREYVNNKVRESIDSLINDSQYGFTIKVDGKEHDVAILSTKSTQDYEKANIIAYNEVGLDRGTIFQWNDENWIILQKMFRPEQPGFNGYAYRCTGELKWIDKNGKLQTRPGYISSGRTTNSLTYTPDINYKFDNILLHDTDWSMIAAIQQDLTLHEEMRFIIKGRAYRVTNIDNVSIDHVSILSMVDDKLTDDDCVNLEEGGWGIANFYSEGYKISCPVQEPIHLYGGDIKDVPILVTLHGVSTNENVIFESADNSIVEISGSKMIGRGIGTTTITCQLEKNKLIKKDIEVFVQEEHVEDTEEIYIEGPDFIEWNNSATYKLSNEADAEFEVEWFSKIKHDMPIFTNNSVTIKIKDKYSGDIKITANTNGQIIEKTVYIKTI